MWVTPERVAIALPQPAGLPRSVPAGPNQGCPCVFRYWHDEIQPDGSVKTLRKYQAVGRSKGDGAITKKQAEVERDKFLAKLNAPTIEIAAEQVATTGVAFFAEIAKMYEDGYLGVRAIMSRVFYYAEGHGLWEEGKRSPASKAKLGKKHYKYERRILSFGETARVLVRLEDTIRLKRVCPYRRSPVDRNGLVFAFAGSPRVWLASPSLRIGVVRSPASIRNRAAFEDLALLVRVF